jgi:hypothetical protein
MVVVPFLEMSRSYVIWCPSLAHDWFRDKVGLILASEMPGGFLGGLEQ